MQGDPPREQQPNFETVDDDFDGDVRIVADAHKKPVQIAVFDGKERVSEWVAALQEENVAWFAEGYATAEYGTRC